jgi:hypothetical protein
MGKMVGAVPFVEPERRLLGRLSTRPAFLLRLAWITCVPFVAEPLRGSDWPRRIAIGRLPLLPATSHRVNACTGTMRNTGDTALEATNRVSVERPRERCHPPNVELAHHVMGPKQQAGSAGLCFGGGCRGEGAADSAWSCPGVRHLIGVGPIDWFATGETLPKRSPE